MEQFRSTLSFVGIGFGSIALVLAVAHFSLGPISPKPTLEQAVADKAVALKQATIAALKGTEAPVARSRELDADRVLSTATAVLGALAMILGVVGYAKKEPLRVAGPDTFVNEIIELAGGENAIGTTVHKYPPISSEVVYACNAEVIIEPAMGRGDIASQQTTAMEFWRRFDSVPAVRDGRIHVINPDTVCRLGPRLYEGIEMIAKCLRPGLFESLDETETIPRRRRTGDG